MLSSSNWLDLNNTWTTNFIREAERLKQDLSDKVRFLFCKGG